MADSKEADPKQAPTVLLPLGQATSTPSPSASPEFQSNIFTQWTYGWLNPLLRRGFRYPLQHDELWQLDPVFRSKQSTLSVGSSVILLYLITWIQDVQAGRETFGDWFGYVMAVSIFVAQVYVTLANNWSTELTTKTGFNARTSLTSALYQKSLRLSAAARQEYSVGKITNIIATDTNRVDISFQYLNMLWAAPYQIIIATALLIWTIGPSALVGFAIMVLYIPFQNAISRKLTQFRRGANVFADKRIKIIQEAMLGIRVIKIYGWEESFQNLMSVLRSDELKQIRGFLMARASVSSITQVVPAFAMLFSFVCYSLLGNSLNPAKTFASLSLFYTLRIPMLFLPIVITQGTDAWVALARITALLTAGEVENSPAFLPASADPDEIAIEVTDASFGWETPPPPQPAEPAKRASKIRLD
nr:hypothetical protein HK105_003602 [Polyrhizophydium stewartii]